MEDKCTLSKGRVSLLTVISCLCAAGEQRPLMETPSALTTYSMYIIMEGFCRLRETHYAEAQREKQYLTIYYYLFMHFITLLLLLAI